MRIICTILTIGLTWICVNHTTAQAPLPVVTGTYTNPTADTLTMKASWLNPPRQLNTVGYKARFSIESNISVLGMNIPVWIQVGQFSCFYEGLALPPRWNSGGGLKVSQNGGNFLLETPNNPPHTVICDNFVFGTAPHHPNGVYKVRVKWYKTNLDPVLGEVPTMIGSRTKTITVARPPGGGGGGGGGGATGTGG